MPTYRVVALQKEPTDPVHGNPCIQNKPSCNGPRTKEFDTVHTGTCSQAYRHTEKKKLIKTKNSASAGPSRINILCDCTLTYQVHFSYSSVLPLQVFVSSEALNRSVTKYCMTSVTLVNKYTTLLNLLIDWLIDIFSRGICHLECVIL